MNENGENKSGRREADDLQALASASLRQAEAEEQAGSLNLAEAQYIRALRAQEQLLMLTGKICWASAARESCSALADLCMQQGNMHGADFYYARMLAYDQQHRLRTEQG